MYHTQHSYQCRLILGPPPPPLCHLENDRVTDSINSIFQKDNNNNNCDDDDDDDDNSIGMLNKMRARRYDQKKGYIGRTLMFADRESNFIA